MLRKLHLSCAFKLGCVPVLASQEDADISLCPALCFGGMSLCAELPTVPHGVEGLNES